MPRKNTLKFTVDLLNNQEFKRAFNTIDKNFSRLIVQYFTRRQQILAKLRTQGHEIDMDDEFTMINGFGRGNFLEPYKLLQREMEKEEYQRVLKALK